MTTTPNDFDPAYTEEYEPPAGYYVIYDAGNNIVSVQFTQPASLPAGRQVKTFPGAPDGKTWNPATLAMDATPALPPSVTLPAVTAFAPRMGPDGTYTYSPNVAYTSGPPTVDVVWYQGDYWMASSSEPIFAADDADQQGERDYSLQYYADDVSFMPRNYYGSYELSILTNIGTWDDGYSFRTGAMIPLGDRIGLQDGAMNQIRWRTVSDEDHSVGDWEVITLRSYNDYQTKAVVNTAVRARSVPGTDTDWVHFPTFTVGRDGVMSAIGAMS